MNIDVQNAAKLAKLRIEDDEAAIFESKSRDILDMLENLPELCDDGVFIDAENVMLLRPDVIGKSLTRDELLANAPQKQAGCIVVPKTVG